jgi:hypothetical protein
MIKSKTLRLIPAIWASLFDIGITIIHQPNEYWNGDLTKGNEGNPVGSLFMLSHISGLFIISGLWLIIISILGYALPKRARRIFLLFCVIAHSYGASTWLSRYYDFWFAMAFILFNSILYSLIEEWAVKSDPIITNQKIQ